MGKKATRRERFRDFVFRLLAAKMVYEEERRQKGHTHWWLK
jgi:hypothetical protein